MAAALAVTRAVDSEEAARLQLAGLKKKWATITSTPTTAPAHVVNKPTISSIAETPKINSTIRASAVAFSPANRSIPHW